MYIYNSWSSSSELPEDQQTSVGMRPSLRGIGRPHKGSFQRKRAVLHVNEVAPFSAEVGQTALRCPNTRLQLHDVNNQSVFHSYIHHIEEGVSFIILCDSGPG